MGRTIKQIVGATSFVALALARRVFDRKGEPEQKARPTPLTRQQGRRATITERRQERSRRLKQRRRRRKFVISAFFVGLGALGSLVSIYSYYTSRISIAPLYMLDPRDPFSTMFSVSNDGSQSIYDVTITCVLNELTNTSSNSVILNTQTSEAGRTRAEQIGAGDKATVKCLTGILTPQGWDTADISIEVIYRPSLYPFHQTRSARFVGEPGADRILRWSQQPNDFQAR